MDEAKEFVALRAGEVILFRILSCSCRLTSAYNKVCFVTVILFTIWQPKVYLRQCQLITNPAAQNSFKHEYVGETKNVAENVANQNEADKNYVCVYLDFFNSSRVKIIDYMTQRVIKIYHS